MSPIECMLENETEFPSNFDNFSISDAMNMEITIQNLQYYLYDIILPVICAFGIVGNILNIIVFLQKRKQKVMDDMEYSTTICLVALAFSDLLFCLTTLPMAFVQQRQLYYDSEFILYYKAYGFALISMFILSSTLLTVTTAVIRYVAICHPFYSQQFISVKVTVVAIVVVLLISFGLNAPKFWYFKMLERRCLNGNFTVIDLARSQLFMNLHFVYAYKILWAIIGNFVPLAILLYCNIRLIKALRHSNQMRISHCRDDTTSLSAHRRITITLVIIIIFFFVLVSPSEITTFMMYVTYQHSKSEVQKSYLRIASIITNFLQSINFSVNFILYYVIIAPFRKALHDFVCRSKYSDSTVVNIQEQQTVMLISLNHHAS